MPVPALAELINSRPFSAVITAADVRACREAWREGDAAPANGFVAGYLGVDERSRHALDTSMRALMSARQGAAFFVNGVFGSGKSHLLGLLALLCEGAGLEAFGATQPALAGLAREFPRRLVVHFSLDDYAADVWGLEAALWREIAAEWERVTGEELAFDLKGRSRGEAFALLDEALHGAGLSGLCLFLDELSLFLSGRDVAGLQRDAAFLQFLGERSRRGPLWVFAALQKSVEHIGAIPEYSLAQIRDRFTMLPLGLAHLPSLVERRLIERRDPARLEALCRETFAELNRSLPELEFGLEEWTRLYPFHPGALVLLEGIAGRFLSRTRSAAGFCARSTEQLIAAGAPATARIGTDELWDYARPEFERHADLMALENAWEAWLEMLPELAPNEGTRPLLHRLLRGLLLFKAAGRAPTVAALCHATGFDAGLPGEANYLYARGLLEAVRTRGPFVVVERGDAPHLDRYAVDLGTRAGEVARRLVLNLRRDLDGSDLRVRDFARRCALLQGLPMGGSAAVGGEGMQEAFWRHMPRRVAVMVWDGSFPASALTNRVTGLREPGQPEDALLVVCPPFGEREDARRAYEGARAEAPDDLTRAALILWLPRPPATDEIDLAREATAAHLLEADPALSDNRRGRAVLSNLRDGAPAREAQLAAIAARLLREGEITTGAGLYADAGELLNGSNWGEWLETVLAFALPMAFPHWETVAPRARVLSSSVADALCLEILRRPPDAPYYAPSHERTVRAVCEPLGLAKAENGRWKITPGRDDLRAEINRLIGEGATLAAVEAQLAKSAWGLTREQCALLVCGMLRGGELVALDARAASLFPGTVGMPLARGIRALRPGAMLPAAEWEVVRRLAEGLNLPPVPPMPDFAAQEAVRSHLLRWREEAGAETELAAARLNQLRRALGPDGGEWPRVEAARARVEAMLRSAGEPGPAAEVLRRCAAAFDGDMRAALAYWREVRERLEARGTLLLRETALLRHPELSVPPELAPAREALLLRLAAGEDILFDGELPDALQVWRTDYAGCYQEWHQAQHDAGRFLSYRRLAAGDAMRALERLETLAARRFAGGAEVRAALREEVAKACSRDGGLRPEAPVCDHCRLRWGERLRLRDPREFEADIGAGLAQLRGALRETAVEAALARDGAGQVLREWRDAEPQTPEGGGGALLMALNEAGLRALEDAFSPRIRRVRSLAELTTALRACGTRSQCEAAFRRWLEGDGLGLDDEIVWEAGNPSSQGGGSQSLGNG